MGRWLLGRQGEYGVGPVRDERCGASAHQGLGVTGYRPSSVADHGGAGEVGCLVEDMSSFTSSVLSFAEREELGFIGRRGSRCARLDVAPMGARIFAVTDLDRCVTLLGSPNR